MKKYLKVLKCTPYSVRIQRRYNPKYEEVNSHVACHCGHSYDRHFDGYEDDPAVSCKYCGCCDFIPYNKVYSEEGLKVFSEYLLILDVSQFTNDLTGKNRESALLEILMHFRRGYAKHYLYSFNEAQILQTLEWLNSHDIGVVVDPIDPPKNKYKRSRVTTRNTLKLSYIQHPDNT